MTGTLWNRVRDGDSAAFAEVFDEYSDWIYNVAFRRTGNWGTAEEIVSTVFLEAWSQRAAITEDDGSIRSWLLGVTLNLIRRHWRQADRQRRATLRLGSDEEHLDHSGDVAERIDAEQAMSRILESLERIPDDQREVVQLWAWEELSYDEIAVVLDVPVGTKSRLHRARDALQHTMDGRHASRRSETRARRRITVVAAVLLSLLGVGGAWALNRQPEQTTRILCPEDMVIAAVSGDPVADCAAALRDVGIEPPEMVAYTNEAGAVVVEEAADEAAEDLQPLGEDFRQDTAIIELEALINDVTVGLDGDCYTTEEAIPIAESAVDRVALDWSVDVIRDADGESTCAYAFPQPEALSVGLSSIEAGLPTDEQPPWIELGRQLHETLDAECLNLVDAAAVVERLADELEMEEMMSSITQTPDDQAGCTRATVTVGGAVFVDLRGPTG